MKGVQAHQLRVPVIEKTDASLLFLQKGDGSEQLADCPFCRRFVGCQDEISETWNFVETAAMVANCDLVITCDTAVYPGRCPYPLESATHKLPKGCTPISCAGQPEDGLTKSPCCASKPRVVVAPCSCFSPTKRPTSESLVEPWPIQHPDHGVSESRISQPRRQQHVKNHRQANES